MCIVYKYIHTFDASNGEIREILHCLGSGIRRSPFWLVKIVRRICKNLRYVHKFKLRLYVFYILGKLWNQDSVRATICWFLANHHLHSGSRFITKWQISQSFGSIYIKLIHCDPVLLTESVRKLFSVCHKKYWNFFMIEK